MPTNIPPKCKLTKWQKQSLQAEADKFVAEFYRPTLQPPPPNPLGNYIVGFSTRWRGAYLHFIATYACSGSNALYPCFDTPFARLGYFAPDSWNIWARRHNDEWMVIDQRLTLPQCFAEMRTNPWFQF